MLLRARNVGAEEGRHHGGYTGITSNLGLCLFLPLLLLPWRECMRVCVCVCKLVLCESECGCGHVCTKIKSKKPQCLLSSNVNTLSNTDN